MDGVLVAIADRLRAEGGLVAGALRRGTPPQPAELGAVAGRRFAIAVEAIREGWLLHYGRSRLLAVEDDPDLALLAGDRLYALGLGELADTGDLRAVATMADVIARSSALVAAGDPEGAEEVWRAGVHDLGA